MACRVLRAVALGLLVISGLRADDDLTQLIDQLVEVSEPGFGYSVYFSGSEFLPYEGTGEMGTLVIGASRATRSETLRKLVERGVDAVPALLAHIDDARRIKMRPVAGMDWMSFAAEYDFNSHTRGSAPEGVNDEAMPEADSVPLPFTVNDLSFADLRQRLRRLETSPDPSSGSRAGAAIQASDLERVVGGFQRFTEQHAVTVGDLCFVALGQIVNRRFSATRYQPTGGLIVNSPTRSSALKKAVSDDWGGLTKERHKQLLVEDFVKPDHEARREGAYLRLAFYYPEAVEQLVLDELSKPMFDSMAIWKFCHDTLYETNDKAERRTKYEDYVDRHGQATVVGLIDQLFDDFDRPEAYELLIQIFGKPDGVARTDHPVRVLPSESERARLIRVMTHDDSRRIGDVVRDLFNSKANDQYLAEACLRCLASRGYADFLIEQIDRIDSKSLDTNELHTSYLEAISTTHENSVRERLLQIVTNTPNDDYFVAALPAIGRTHDDVVLRSARRLLERLPAETDRGGGVLGMILDRYPDQAREILDAFVAIDSAERRETMCRVLWYGNPLSKEVLAPFLDDKRELPDFDRPIRVCDRAAQAISHTTRRLRFDTDWSLAKRDEQIAKIKAFCGHAP